jgi:hypothetical protein
MSDEALRFESPEHVLSTELDRETVFLNVHTERYYSLDEIGTRCWQLLNEHGDVDIVLGQLAVEFDADAATLRRDLTELLDGMAAAGLLKPRP